MHSRFIDLNADLGEGVAWELEVLPYISSANVACGAYAGSEKTTRKSVEACLDHKVQVGAHPGYPDQVNFGRRAFSEIGISYQELAESLNRQLSLIPEATYVKPHGAFYNETAKSQDETLADILIQLLKDHNLPLLGLPFTAHVQIADAAGVRFLKEGFIDRRYDENHQLLPRSEPNSIIYDRDEAIQQALRLAESCDSLCVHGDNHQAIELLASVRDALIREGYEIKPC
ncbi:MAG: LamB/YcsF family protein [Fimbriimonadaceae bacterium]|nr:MAG: LamB/YcsF family protein [Fimbriimonadaceae bacterium]